MKHRSRKNTKVRDIKRDSSNNSKTTLFQNLNPYTNDKFKRDMHIEASQDVDLRYNQSKDMDHHPEEHKINKHKKKHKK